MTRRIGTDAIRAAAFFAIAFTPGPRPAKAAEDAPKWSEGPAVQLFNGKDLTGFSTYLHTHHYTDPNHVFTVHDGLIHVSGEEFGGFATKRTYRDYHLIVEWKWGVRTWPPRQGKAMDSGILVHCVGPEGAAGGHWMQSIECQIIQGGCGDILPVAGREKSSISAEVEKRHGDLYWRKGGANVTIDGGRINWFGRDPAWKDVQGFRGKEDVERPAGEWNRQEVIADGDRLTYLLNGTVVNEGFGARPSAGKIQFQSEGAEIFFRKIELRPLRK